MDTCAVVDAFTVMCYCNYGCSEVNVALGLVNNFVEKHCLKHCYSKCGPQTSRTAVS